ncbi:hypothetical protein C7H83_11270 [Tetragenococcus halophilus]|uniref:Uncharacterized protein n=1 Tax=Tetragenococcus halophilus TaxID=51669 RepID=A0A3G5FL41_TETHA|nr:hypothetical protein [Tetragenococcus halophilus]AYW51009.1 hypothetical protein C7H83_11270 [Tetragenococcus halophilus]GBD64310.1 hypothetical protein TEHD23766T_1737 [Tetragenococcus halophilus subsp. flandriensis]
MKTVLQVLLVLLTLGDIYFFFFAETNEIAVPLSIVLILIVLFYQFKFLKKKRYVLNGQNGRIIIFNRLEP